MVIVASAVALPLVIGIIAYLWRPWYPVLDMAMTELRVRDVGTRRTPLIGLPGRIGEFPDQGSHPGPLSFWLVAIAYRLGGSGAWGMQLGAVAVHIAAVLGLVAVFTRRLGAVGLVTGALMVAVLVRGYGITVLSHPWNPYLPLLVWALVLVAAWAVLCGDRMLAVVVVLGASLAAQTHVPYLPLAVSIVALTLGWLLIETLRSDGPVRRAGRRALGWAVGAGTLVWLPPIVDQLRREPGNIRMLLDHFGTPREDPVGLVAGGRIFLRHLDVVDAVAGLLWRPDSLIVVSGRPYDTTFQPSIVIGALVLAAFVASIAYAWRRRIGELLRLQLVTSVALAIGLVSMTRIFGTIWYYLTLWAWPALLLVMVSIGWASTDALRRHRPTWSPDRRRLMAATGAAAAVLTVISIGAATVARVPDPMLSAGLGAVIDPTVAAVTAGTGPAVGADGSYIVFWQDSVFIGAQGYGLVNELERRGFDVGVHPTWRVPVTPWRVKFPGENDAEIHLVSGMFIEQWRERPGHVEVLVHDARTPSEAARFDELRARVTTDLVAIGRDDLVPEVSINLFGASLDPDIPERIRRDLAEMILLGEPIAIFLAPAGSTF